MHRFIEHISSEEYWFSGVFSTPDGTSSETPFVATGTFLNDGGLLVFEGTWRYAPRTVSHPISLRVAKYQARAASVELSSPLTGTLKGHIYSLGQGYELLAAGPAGLAFSARIEPLARQELCLSGAIQSAGQAFCFLATGSPDEERASLGNVVSISGGRRA